jgi:hypothetical protein
MGASMDVVIRVRSRFRWRALAATLALAAVHACSDVQRTPAFVVPEGGILHPEAASLQSNTTSGRVLRVESPGRFDLPAHLSRLATFDDQSAFGKLDGSPAEVFGRIIDAAVLPDSHIALLDANYGTVRIVSADGRSLGAVGSFGNGPGQFVEPKSLSLTAAGGLLVLDHGGMRIEVFPEPLQSKQSIRINAPVAYPYGACSIDDRLFVTGLRITTQPARQLTGTDMVHEVDSGGTILRSFSQPYARMSDPLVASTYSPTQMACDATAGGSLWVAYALLGEVHAFGPDGELRWIAVLTDVRIPRHLQLSGRIGVYPGQGDTIEHINRVRLLSADALAVQVHSRTLQSDNPRRWEVSYRTYLLDPRNGAVLGSFAGDHQVIGGGGGRAILYREHPYPQIAVVDIRAEAGR